MIVPIPCQRTFVTSIRVNYAFQPRAQAGSIRPSCNDRSHNLEHPRRGMPPLWVYEAADGVLVVYNGVTGATRVAKLLPGRLIRVEVIGRLQRPHASSPK